jgi:hypothetical protein
VGPDAHGHDVVIANFRAQIVVDVLEDDGSDTLKRDYTIKASRAGINPVTLTIPSGEFEAMGWTQRELGASFIINSS